MGQTAGPLFIRYPEPTDQVRDAATAMRIAAEDINGKFGSAVAVVDQAESGSNADGSLVSFPGTHLAMAGFTFDGVTLTRVGPGRLFVVSVEVQTELRTPNGGANFASASSTVEILANGDVFTGSHDSLDLIEATIAARSVVHNITMPVGLGNGDTIQVRAVGSAGTTVGIASIRAYPCAPENT